MRKLAFVLALVAACKRPHKAPAADAAVDAAPPPAVTAETTPFRRIEVKDVPQGHWEASDAPKLALSIFAGGVARFATEVPTYRNAARVFGDIKHAEALSDDAFQITVDVTKILVKEIGPAHRYFTDYDLFEAAILGQRVTSPVENGQRIPQLDGGTSTEAPRTWALHFDPARETVELCTTNTPAVCRKLARHKSPSDFSRERTHAECKVDTDCVTVTSGEQCDPCLCPSRPSVRSWPKRIKPEDRDKDESWERTPEHLCGRAITRRGDCPACPELKVVCKHKACVLRK